MYVDTNGNGIPDAFENRPCITEVLNAEPGTLSCDRTSLVIEIEKTPRSPKRGEWFIAVGHPDTIKQAEFDYGRHGGNPYTAFIIRRVIAGEL